ncbi:hypothetical protein BU15DRAFT_65366 [Melanogaster broomeanus]|nr:hypothetical protein BU15DRAFT_65366 [Melanogaster broomeanus]
MVRTSLVDDDTMVHTAAAKAFDTLQEHIGAKVIDQIIPTLLEALRQPRESSGTPIQALREAMSVRTSTVFPILIPTLIATPMTVFNARALTSLITVARNALSKCLMVVLTVLENEQDEEILGALDEAQRALLESIGDPEVSLRRMIGGTGPALASMLKRIPNHVGLFFPQLQRTLVKSISNPSSIVVRTRAADVLGILMCSQPRVDPVVIELIGSTRGSEEEIAASFVLALSYVVWSASVHGGIGDRVRETCVELVHEAFRESHEGNYQCFYISPYANNQCLSSRRWLGSLLPYPGTRVSEINREHISSLRNPCIGTVLQPEDVDYCISPDDTLFAKLGVLRSVALKVKESGQDHTSPENTKWIHENLLCWDEESDDVYKWD